VAHPIWRRSWGDSARPLYKVSCRTFSSSNGLFDRRLVHSAGILIAGILWILWTQRTKMILSEKLGYGAILVGALSNGMDRLLYGRVVDFLSLKYFAIFNVADIVISIGACLLVVSSLYLSRYAIYDSRRASRTTENR
jgi:lipoprotein signal peptidase